MVFYQLNTSFEICVDIVCEPGEVQFHLRIGPISFFRWLTDHVLATIQISFHNLLWKWLKLFLACPEIGSLRPKVISLPMVNTL